MTTDDQACIRPWRFAASILIFCLLMFAAGPLARAWQLTGNAKLPLLIPGLIAMLWMAHEGMRLTRLSGNATAAIIRYMRRLIPLWFVYFFVLIAAINIQRHLHPQGLFAIIVAILPALPLIGFIWALGRLLIEEDDEFQQMMHIRRALIATGFLLVVSTIWGFLEGSDLAPHLPAWSAFIIWNIGLLFAGILPWARR